jgi:hypothetical protein
VPGGEDAELTVELRSLSELPSELALKPSMSSPW